MGDRKTLRTYFCIRLFFFNPSALPSELKRKGRFDENFFVDLPTVPERAQILSIHVQRFGITVEDEYLEAIATPRITA
ncbi:hypothetical protein [Tolypothrix sp. VBCCA 56010]|uniref:hypothetical protein n=1 Tax=Tolypothrix sp. VBCCA 56010 TaxID=3137731 RepID=UPI003D7C5601